METAERRPDLTIRLAEPADDPQIVSLLRSSLGKEEDRHYVDFLRWKHQENPFGRSPAWVALDGDQIVGFRTFLRWDFLDGEGRRLRAVRAVDTATHPEHQGRGIFRRLTLDAVADLTRAGDAFVFNTPNDKSRPGYLKMGWSTSARVPVGVLPSGPRALAEMARSKVPAALWSEETDVGDDARFALADPAIGQALIAHESRRGVRTARDAAYLSWRTGFGPLRYRILWRRQGDPQSGALIFRLRARGDAVEAAVVEAFVPDPRTHLHLLRELLRETGADYVLSVRSGRTDPLIPVPRVGPVLTVRPLAASPPAPGDWSLSLADVELF